VAVIKLCEFI